MKIYLNTIGNRIISVDCESNNSYTKTVTASNIDDFYDKTKDLFTSDEEIDEQIRNFFDSETTVKSVSSYNIKHWVSNRSFGEIIDMYENGEIIKPDMQRSFVWDSQKSSRLIESIILGLPIPPLFLMEVGNNKYELIDGFQRITTISNYVLGRPWHGGTNEKKAIASKLSKNVINDLQGKSFEKLNPEYQRIIKRSTVPLIEFRQMSPEDLSSKYLIFERINTGSEKLNQMQIRKSLAYGPFIDSLYKQADNCIVLKDLFSNTAIKKDAHVEAFLRVYAMSEIVYRNFDFDKSGLNNILNYFCESFRNNILPDSYFDKVIEALYLAEQIFGSKSFMFKRVEKKADESFAYVGTRNISIMESILGVAIEYGLSVNNVDVTEARNRYNNIMYDIIQKAINGICENPFSTSTGTKHAIINRFKYAEQILGV